MPKTSEKNRRPIFYIVVSDNKKYMYGAFHKFKEAQKYRRQLEKERKEKFRVIRK